MLGFDSPASLWLLALLPLLWLGGRVGRRGRRWTVHGLVRMLLLICLIGALSQPVLLLSASRLALVYLVDVSHSVSTNAVMAAGDQIDATNENVRPDESRILAFGRRAIRIADTAGLRRLALRQPDMAIESLAAPEGTNLEEALAAARAEIPAAANGRIVLFSDGRQTEGEGRRMAQRLAAARVPVFTQPSEVRDIGDVWIQDVRLPQPAVAGDLTTVHVIVGAQAAHTAVVELREGTRVLARARTVVAAGGAVVPLKVSFHEPGPHLIQAAVDAADDVLEKNNTFQRELIVARRPRVLYVHTEVDDPGVAPVALAQSGVEIRVARPQTLPLVPQAFDAWDVVVLSNIRRALLSTETMAALSSWVEERGGGLLFVGGNAVFGEGLDAAERGYRRSEVERVLPVTFDRDDEPDVALVIVLDRSWSMNGAPMELSKAAAEAAAGTLSSAQLIGVLSFNNNSNWDVPLARVRDSRETLHQAIAGITASGPTAIYPALESAYDALAAVRARSKHVILLSDGQSAPQDYEGLARKMAAARITVSSVAFGPEADAALLRNIARWGGGRDYVVHDAHQIPQIFVKEAKSASTSGADSNAIVPVMRQTGGILQGIGDIPRLQERNVVTRRAGAVELLGTSRNDPLLTIWPAGLGRTAMFAADVDGRWTRDWMRWPGLGAFLSTMVRTLAPTRQPLSSLSVTPRERQGSGLGLNLDVSLEVRDRDAHPTNLLTPSVEVRSSANRATLLLTQVASGRYAAPMVADTTEPLVFSVEASPGLASASRIFVTDQAAEYRFAATDEALLSAISRTTGGSIRPTADDLRRAPRTAGVARHGLAPWLLALAVVLWPVDICLRRFQR